MNEIIRNQCEIIWQLGGRMFLADESNSYSCENFVSSVYEVMEKLKKIGCKEGEGIMLGAANGLDYFISFVAILANNCVVIPFDKSASEDVLSFVIEKTKPRILFGKNICEVTNFSDTHKVKTFSGDIAAILFTSGSSGIPKGVVLSKNAIFGNASATLKVIDFKADDHLFVNTPYHFTSAICHFFAAFFSTGKLTIIQKKLLPANLATAVVKSGVNAFGGAPIQLLWLVSFPNAGLNLRWVMTSGDDLPTATQIQLSNKYPQTNLFVFYGLTECGGRFCARLPSTAVNHCSVGRPIPGMKVEIVDSELNSLPPEKIGEIIVSGDYLMNGYLGAENRVFTAQGGLKSGDSGYLDKTGNVYLLGRLDDVFKVAGNKVSGLKIRDAALQTNMVSDAVVIPYRDTNVGVIPALVYVENPSEKLVKSSFLQMLRNFLPTNHLPRKLIVVDHIERTGSGKIVKTDLINNLGRMHIQKQIDGSYTYQPG